MHNLSVLLYSVLQELSNEEIAALSQSTALVVSALSSLLVDTLALPVAGSISFTYKLCQTGVNWFDIAYKYVNYSK